MSQNSPSTASALSRTQPGQQQPSPFSGIQVGWGVPQTNPLQYTFGISSDPISGSSSGQRNGDNVDSASALSRNSIINRSTSSSVAGTVNSQKRGRDAETDGGDSDSEMSLAPASSPPSRHHPSKLKRLRATGVAPNLISTSATLTSSATTSSASSSSLLSTSANNTTVDGSMFQSSTATATLPHPDTSASLLNRINSLERDQLVTLVTSLLGTYPFLSSHVGALIPRPTLQGASAHLSKLERRIWDSLPYSRNPEDSRSDYAFNRVRASMLELRAQVVQDTAHFASPASYPDHLQHEFPHSAFGYLHVATAALHRLPAWSSSQNNAEVRDALYVVVAKAWKSVSIEVGRRIRVEGRMFPADLVGEWARNLMMHCETVSGRFGFREAMDAFGAQLGGCLGLQQGLMVPPMATGRQLFGQQQHQPLFNVSVSNWGMN